MIKIQQHLNRHDADDYLDLLASNMFSNLNQKKQGGSFKQNSLIKKLEQLILESNTEVYFNQICNNDSNLLQRQQAFLSYLQEHNYSKLEDIVTSRPTKLLAIKNEILQIINEIDIYKTNGAKISQTPFGVKLVADLFSYKNFRKSSFCSELLIDAGFENVTCPYCNDNSVSIVDISQEEDEENLLRAYLDLDHFYPKAKNPFFAVSFYNLVPSCHTCNSREKSDKDFCINTHIHPYHESFNEHYKFLVHPFPLGLGETPIIEIQQLGTKRDLSEVDLRLELRYNGLYREEVLTLINMYQKYRVKASYYANEYGIDWQEALLQNTPISEHLILRNRAGKMFRDIFQQIDEIRILTLL